MKVVVIGSGARESVIIKRLLVSEKIKVLFVLPGRGPFKEIDERVELVNIEANDVMAILFFCMNEEVDLVVVGPEDPLALGLSDMLKAVGIACFGFGLSQIILVFCITDLSLQINKTRNPRSFIFFRDIIGIFSLCYGLLSLGIFKHESRIKLHGLQNI